MDPSTVFERNPVVVTRHVAGDVFLVPVKGHLAQLGRLYALSGVGEYIWLSLNAERTLGDLRDGIIEAFDVSADTAWNDLVEFLTSLHDADLVRERSVP